LIPLTLRAISSEEERAAGWNEFMETIPEKLRDWWLNNVCEFRLFYLAQILWPHLPQFSPAMVQLSADALGPEYLLNSWHLHIFGIAKDHQGKGYGRALYELVEKQACLRHLQSMTRTYTDTWTRSGQSRRITYGVGNNDRTGC